MRIILSLLVLLALPNLVEAQIQSIDSLYSALKKHSRRDTTEVQIHIAISENIWGSDPQKTKEHAQKALAISQESGYTRGLADAYRELSRYYWTQTEYDRSTEYALRAIQEYENCNEAKGISWCYATIGSNYSQANNYEKANQYHHMALALNTKIGNTAGIARNINSLGYVCELQKDYRQALKYYQEALDIRIGLRDKTDLTLSYSNVGSIYYFLEEYPLALEYLFKALPLALEIDNKNYIALIYQNIGEVYYKTGRYEEALRYLDKALLVADQIGDKKRKEGVYEALKNLEEARGNYKAAFKHLNNLQQVRDTLYTQDRSRQMARMEAMFETGKKEQTIKLMAQEKRIQTIWRNVLFAGVFMSLILAGVIYQLQRSRNQKTKQLLEVEQALNERLKDLDKLKSRFFANISHEFRTPLTLLLGPLEEKLSVPDLSEEERSNFLLMKRNANRLLELVNQLLDLTKLEAGKMSLAVQERNDLNDFIRMLASSFDSWADTKKVKFIKYIQVPTTLYCYDADVVEKILTNLLSNAFKFTPAGGTVTLQVDRERNPVDHRNWIHFQVSDTGKGIPDHEQADIFSPFYQAKPTAPDGQVGTGLGLSLVKELTKLYGGSMELMSKENHGTRITVLLPADKQSFTAEQFGNSMFFQDKTFVSTNESLEAPGDPMPSHGMSAETILIVEDNSDMRDYITSILKNEFAIITARNGQEGIDLARQHVPSIVVSDLMMPIADGIELTTAIKNDVRTSHIPVILLTARNESESKIQGLHTGADEYLTKPFSAEELKIRLHNLVVHQKRMAARFQERFTILPSPSSEASVDEKFLHKIRQIIEDNLGDFTFGVEALAENVNLSRTQLLRKLKALTGFTPTDFIRDLRLKKAAVLIASKADTIAQVGYRVGFNDQSYFAKCFKKQFGVAPSDYSETEKIHHRNVKATYIKP